MITSKPMTCITWHDIASEIGAATAFLGATTTPDALAHQLDHLEKHYTIIDLDRLLSGDLPDRAALLTFDDAYASIARVAAPMLAARKLPSVLFVNPAPVTEAHVPLDLLASLFASRYGEARLGAVGSAGQSPGPTFAAFMDTFVAHLDLAARDHVKARLLAALETTEADLHRALDLFMRPDELAGLPNLGMEVANHTRTHVHCGALNPTELDAEIITSQAAIAAITGRPVRAFAFPWGRQHDATDAAMSTIRRGGHEATFLVHGRNNRTRPAPDVWYRVLLRSETGARLTAALSVLPALREWRSRLAAPVPFPAPSPRPQPTAAD